MSHPPRYMLDTNICIYLMKNEPEEVGEKLAECYEGEVVMSAITLGELEYGIAAAGAMSASDKTKARRALTALLADIHVLSFDGQAARIYGEVRLATKERKRDMLDKLIAAHAISNNITLVTNNLDDFKAYPKLKLENWVEA